MDCRKYRSVVAGVRGVDCEVAVVMTREEAPIEKLAARYERNMHKPWNKPVTNADHYIDPSNDDFGAVLNCAVRYSIGRQTYMPKLVIDFITPLIPHLDNRTLGCFDRDVTDAKWEGGYGDPIIDEPAWLNFLALVRGELAKRGQRLYKSWRED